MPTQVNRGVDQLLDVLLILGCLPVVFPPPLFVGERLVLHLHDDCTPTLFLHFTAWDDTYEYRIICMTPDEAAGQRGFAAKPWNTGPQRFLLRRLTAPVLFIGSYE